GAQARAAELGYRLEHFWLRAPGVTARRFSRVMHSRGIKGLLFPPVPPSHSRLELDWERFSTVAFGYSLREPRVNRVVHHHFHTITTGLSVLRSRGYQRIALAITPYHDDGVANLWSAGFLAFRELAAPSCTVPHYRGPMEAKPFLSWFRRHRPDAILSDELTAVSILAKAGYRVPHDCGFVSLDWHEHTRLFAGIDQRSAELGGAAAKAVIASLQHDEYGVPAHPGTFLIEGTWVEGASLPRTKGPVPAATAALEGAWIDRDYWQ
ncbi:MAG TPA: substrate-binding domain-containing protein, partial [Dehalococcoidia bacterium]|nr:substrate-binding domain-containing protein [Dehalococcoidia bacterium]